MSHYFWSNPSRANISSVCSPSKGTVTFSRFGVREPWHSLGGALGCTHGAPERRARRWPSPGVAAGHSLLFRSRAVYVQGAILLIVGGVFISLADNVLRPVLVGRDTRMPDYLVLVSTLGGLLLFGLAGVVIGPIIAALFISVWGMAAKEYGE